jgi:hypothetical protein
MKRRTTLVQNVRILAVAAALAGSAWGCGGGGSDSTGAAGTSGAAGSTGTCDAETEVFSKHFCTTAGACHDANGTAANFDMASADWQTHLVGVTPKGGGTVPSMCENETMPYLVAQSSPATGLFLRKLAIGGGVPCGAQMPNLPPLLNATEKACVQSWANAITKPN